MKRTHKLKGMGDISAVVAGARSMGDAATALGVNRSTLHRWIKAGKVSPPGPGPRPRKSDGPSGPVPADATVADPEAWATAVHAERELSPTDLRLVALGKEALLLAITPGHPAVRLSAMGRFQAIVKQLGLDRAADAADVGARPFGRASVPARPRGAAVSDPRRILSAVK